MRCPSALRGVLVVLVCLAIPFSAARAADGAKAVEGTVLDPAGRPVAGAQVAAGVPPASPAGGAVTRYVETTTGEDGQFRIDAPEGKDVFVRAAKAGYAAATAKLRAGTPAELRLGTGATLSGQVFDRASGRPLAGATVAGWARGGVRVVDPTEPEKYATRTQTDGGGRFTLKDLPAGFVSVWAIAEGHARSAALEASVGVPEAPTAPAMIYLGPGVTIAGRVVDAAGKPVAGAEVAVSPSGGFGREILDWRGVDFNRARSDLKGLFEIRGMPTSPQYTLTASAPAMATVRLTGLRAPAGRNPNPVTLTLEKGTTLVATLKADGAPYAGPVAIDLTYDASQRMDALRVRREDDDAPLAAGVLRIDRLTPGSARVEIDCAGFAKVVRKGVNLVKDKPADLGEIALDRGLTITGTVLDPQGQPVAGAKVKAEMFTPGNFVSVESRPGSDGAFTIGGLTKDVQYSVTASAEGYGRAEAKGVKPGAAATALVIAPQGKLRVAVSAGDPPAPVRAVKFEVQGASSEDQLALVRRLQQGERAETLAAADGNYTVERLDAGKISLKVSAPGFIPVQLTDVEIRGGETVDVPALRLDRGATINGTVLDKATRQPLAAANVSLEAGGLAGMMRGMVGGGTPDAVSGPDGRFVLSGLPPGRQTVKAERDGYAPVRLDVEIAAGTPYVDATLEAGRGGVIEGIVRDQQGRAQPGSLVIATAGIGASLRLTTSADDIGHYRLEYVVPGAYTVISMPMPGQDDEQGAANLLGKMQMKQATVVDEKVTTLDFGPEPQGLRVHGTVRRGKEPLGVQMFWTPRSGGAAGSRAFGTARSNADGSYEVRVPAPGVYRVAIVQGDNGQRGGALSVTVAGGPDVALDIVVPRSGVTGRAVDTDNGERLTGVAVTALALDADGRVDQNYPSLASGQTDEDGAFDLSGLAPGRYRLFAGKEGYGRVSLGPVKLGEDEVKKGQEIGLAKSQPVKVRVLDETGTPLEGATVLPLADGSLLGFGTAITGADGSVTMRQLADGTHDLAAVYAGRAIGVARGVAVGPREANVAEIKLRRGVPVEFHVKDAAGRPASDLAFRIIDEQGSDISALIVIESGLGQRGMTDATDGTGTLKIGTLVPGKYDVSFLRAGEVAARKTIDVKETENDPIELEVP